MLFSRESGVLLHPTSLPGRFGIGEIGGEALRWLDVLASMDQRLWQMLPLGPTGFGDSPYQSLSTFAVAPLLLSLDLLASDGLLDRSELHDIELPHDRVDYGATIAVRRPLLRSAAVAFLSNADPAERAAFEQYCAKHASWLEDYAVFGALKEANDGRPWFEWPTEQRDREPEALARAREEHRDHVEQVKALQYLFAHQWQAVRNRAHALGIRLIGDIPIFVAHDSADVWQHRELFLLDEVGQTVVVAGVPPDYFSRTGQRWGNPLYRWEEHVAEDFAWWTARLRRVLELVDIVRIDHFRGFAACWEIPADEPTAEHGRWVPAPGDELFGVLRRELGELPIIAEDLGLITPDVAELRDRLGLPGMRVFQFAFGDDEAENPHLPDNYVENCVAYSGTHDNDTLAGWLDGHADGETRTADEIAREHARLLRYVRRKKKRSPTDVERACIDILLRSRAGAVVLPLQDILGLGSEARMNTPGCAYGNWSWRFRWEQLTAPIQSRLARAIEAAGRNR